MLLRPCIDIHNGAVKQIVGSSLRDEHDAAKDNFVSEKSAAYYADLYRQKGLWGGHIILLNKSDSDYYKASYSAAIEALAAYKGGLMIGGGINPGNAEGFLKAGASKVIVTSYVFENGHIKEDKLKDMVSCVGKENLVLDLSCRKTDNGYFVATNRWQIVSETKVNEDLFFTLSESASEFLVHAVDVEGKANGIEEKVASIMGNLPEGFISTYAGGVHSYEDIKTLKQIGKNRVDVTVGSALDLFGGNLLLDEIVKICAE